ncbi:helix-turn-helix domain-containing protein [Conchiformibius kuhniae]|uniref:Helix-turn-helix domain-containing protein n=1 Tax=Conchiformibius kuhniae TaxID=211502 RepID=A0A8T9MWE9_9NEIS|nr:helix-turn-helix transcriptional regulator [Conchiformibius kuhniae]UOP05491.1 helix-turn-helix domain-containing protein [Conchiformibius kuhniae]
MSVHDKIRLMREINRWSQEEMAKRLNMSPNGYAKIERGETKLHLDKLTQIAEVFKVDVLELMTTDKGVVFFMNERCDYNYMGANACHHTHYAATEGYAELDRLKLVLAHKDEVIEYKNNELQAVKNELAALKKLVALLEQQGADKKV